MLRNLSIAARIFLLLALTSMYALLLAAAFTYTANRIERASVQEMEEAMLRAQQEKVRVATHSMAVALGQILAGVENQVRRDAMVLDAVGPLRFGPDRSGYYFVFEGTRNVALPGQPHYQGKDMRDVRDSAGVYLVRELREQAVRGGGFVRYRFPLPGGEEEEPKLGYAEIIPGTNLWIGTGVYLANVDREKSALAQIIDSLFARHMTVALLGFAATFLAMGLVALSVARSIVQPISQVTRAAVRIADGELDVVLPAAGKDEISRMQDALNRMSRTLKHDIELIQKRTDYAEEQARIARDALRETEVANREVVRQITERVESLRKITMAVAHQLRNPMTIIGGLARLLARKPELQGEYLEYLDGILEAAGRIERITEVVSDYSSLRLGELRQTPVAELAEEARAASEGKTAALARRVSWKIDVQPVCVPVDKALMIWALAEIMDNAVESLPGGVGEVRIEAARENGAVALKISDTGRGIPEAELPYVLDPFYTTKAVAVGIGLPKADRIVHEHGGTMSIASSEGRGTTVTIRLPLEHRRLRDPASSCKEQPASEPSTAED